MPTETLRGERNGLYRLAYPKITVRSRLSDTPTRPPPARFHVDNIGIISNTLHDLDGDVYDYPDETYDDTDGAAYRGYGELAWPADRRARAVALVLGGVVALGAIGTAVIINSGDSATTKATLGAPVPTISSAPRTTAAPSASPSPSRAPLPSETVTTVPPSSARPTPSLSVAPRPTAAPPPINAVPPPALNPRTVVYSVTGTKQLLDLVNVVYTDARGYPVTEFNVSLPWAKMVVLNPGVQTESVVATSFSGRLNCAVVNAQGQTVVASVNNAIIATCTR